MFFISKKHYPSYVFYPENARLQDHPHCGVLCRPHRTVRTAPVLKAENYPTTTITPQFILTFFVEFLDKKSFQKDFKNFFSKYWKKA